VASARCPGATALAFLERYGRLTGTALLAREFAEGLPDDHSRHFYFLATEADALRARDQQRKLSPLQASWIAILEQALR
jgi:hypothetical protein